MEDISYSDIVLVKWSDYEEYERLDAQCQPIQDLSVRAVFRRDNNGQLFHEPYYASIYFESVGRIILQKAHPPFGIPLSQ